MITYDKIVQSLENEIMIAERVGTDYCNSVNVQIIKDTLIFIKKQKEENEILQSKLEKQIPKKPIKTPDNHKWFCPTCHNPIRLGRNHCCNCGQALDWSEEEWLMIVGII